MADVKQPGMGDLRKEEIENLMDKYLRQTRLGGEAEVNYPNLSKLYGAESLRDKARQDMYNKVAQQLQWPNVEGKETSEINDALRNLKRSASGAAANALEDDILKPDFSNMTSDTEDGLQRQRMQLFADAAQKRLGSNKELNFAEIEGAYGFNSPEEIVVDPLRPHAKGTVLHEIGHSLIPESIPEETRNIGKILLPYTQKAANKEVNEMPFSSAVKDYGAMGGLVKALDSTLGPATLNSRAVNEGIERDKGRKLNERLQRDKPLYDLMKGMESGHFGKDVLDYPIEQTWREYAKEMQGRGFEREVPEEAKKFEKLKYLFPKK